MLWDRLFRLKRQGVTLVLTTHYMDEAEQLCDRLVVMDNGRIVAEGSPARLIDEHVDARGARAAVRRRRSTTGASPTASTAIGERIEVLPDRRARLRRRRRRRPRGGPPARGLRPLSALVRRTTLEDVFLRLTGRTLID